MSPNKVSSSAVMGERKIALRLVGDVIPLSLFLSAAQNFYGLLKDLDTAISGKPTLMWNLSDLSLGSAVMEATPALIDEEVEDVSPVVIEAVVSGLEEIEHGAKRPTHFSDEALHSAKQLVETLGNGVSRIMVTGTVGSKRKQVLVTQRIAASVNDLIGIQHLSMGSVEGTLEMISVHGGAFFNVYEFLHGKRVRCDFPKEMLESVKDALGKRVLVYGEIRSSARGQPLSVKAQRLRIFKEPSELPRVDDLVGLDRDFTGGVQSGDYPRRLWGAES